MNAIHRCVPIQMGCGSSSESVTTGNISPHPSEYYLDRVNSNTRKNSVIPILDLKQNEARQFSIRFVPLTATYNACSMKQHELFMAKTV